VTVLFLVSCLLHRSMRALPGPGRAEHSLFLVSCLPYRSHFGVCGIPVKGEKSSSHPVAVSRNGTFECVGEPLRRLVHLVG
jgi:hypothetical protein